jgi:hypothetical protein
MIYFKEVDSDTADWIDLAQEGDKWWPVLKTSASLSTQYGKFLD